VDPYVTAELLPTHAHPPPTTPPLRKKGREMSGCACGKQSPTHTHPCACKDKLLLAQGLDDQELSKGGPNLCLPPPRQRLVLWGCARGTCEQCV